MKIKPLRCPFCGAPIKIMHDRYLKCDFCRGRFIVENSNESIEVWPQEIRTPEELNDWNEFWGEILDNGNYYDVDEVEDGYRTIQRGL